MDLTNRRRRWAVAIAVIVCLVAPLLVACNRDQNADRPKESPQMQQLRKQKQNS